MDDTTAGPHIAELRHKITQLQARRDDLAASVAHEPAPPPAGTLERLRAYLEHTITRGTDAQRKRAIAALVAEVRINQKGQVTPVFRIPDGSTISTTSGDIAATTTELTGLRNSEVGGAEVTA
jgi:site-specific DNA recombinase